MQQWSVIPGVCGTPGAEGYPTYGVRATLSDGSVWTWADVDTDRAATEALARRLQALQPERCHFEDLVLDYLEELAGKV